MITFSIIKKSQLEGAQRLDAEYYQPEYLVIAKKLSSEPKLIEVSRKITDFGAYSQMNFVEFSESGARFFRNQDVGEVFVNDEEKVFIPKETYNKLSLKLEELDIITPRVGTLGNAAIISKQYLPATANQNLAQIKSNSGKIDPFYLSVFLSCKFGKSQFKRLATGNVQPWLNLQQIESIKVYLPSLGKQHEIKKRVDSSWEALEESRNFNLQAENLLLEELELKDLLSDDSESKGYSVMLSEVQNTERIDAEYFQPKYEELTSAIKKQNASVLSDLVTMKKGFEPGREAYQEEGNLFIRVSSLSKFGVDDKDQKYLSNDLYQQLKKDYEPKRGEILLTKDATPGIAYMLKNSIEGIISGGILRLKVKADIEPEYLTLCINSLVGQQQAERDAGGSIIVHWRPEQIKQLLIPIIPLSKQQEIAEFVVQSHHARKKAKELLEQAKREVEEMVEYENTK